MGERLGGYVYGTIVVLAVIVAGAKAYPHDAGHVAVLVVITTAVFWLAHVYSHALAHSITRDQHLSLAELRGIARHEAAIIEAGALPLVPLVLGAVGILSDSAAGWAAVAMGLAVLAIEGVVFARAERLRPLASLVVITLNLGLGLVIVALKVFVTH